ncbi:MAG: serine/threonine-protein kinase [Dokdonella sp.]
MNGERHQRIKAIVDSALGLPSAERAHHVRVAAGLDADLANEALRWLAATDAVEADGFLESGPVLPDEPAEIVGSAQHRYRILSEIGRGGMGTVYLAERADGEFRQQVALKLVHVSAGDDQALAARFRSERQMLADLNHPNIARLLDGGSARDGRPFLVMEYIAGERIDRWCETRDLSLRDCAALMTKVCAAVTHAHQNLIVHRDLKPANILIDQNGEPKLLDFGIAKLLPTALARDAVTATEYRWLTYAYASPEQIRGGSIGTAADQYSLGVILYTLITRRSPYANPTATPPELARAICDETPAAPSRRLRGAGESRPQSTDEPVPVRKNRARAADHDLDAIVLKALRKEPAERYPSVDAFATDLRRYLDGLPVVARKGSRWYSTHKFVSRHRVGVAVSALLLLLLVGFGIDRQRQLEQTRIERDKARSITEFVVGMFESADPLAERTAHAQDAASLTVRDVLDRNAPRVDAELAEQPEIRGALLGVMGRAYVGLQLGAPARRYLSDALRAFPTGSANAVEIELYLAEALASDGEYAAALEGAEQALIHARALAPAQESRDVGRALRLRAGIFSLRGNEAEAQRDLENAHAMLLRTSGPSDPYTIGSVLDLGYQARRAGKFADCVRDAEEARRAWAERLGVEHFTLVAPRMLRARCLHSLGRSAEAETELNAIVALQRRVLGPRNVAVANTLNELAVLLTSGTGRDAEAEPLLRESLSIYDETYGVNHPLSAVVLGNLGQSVGSQGRHDEAVALLTRAVVLGASNPLTDSFALTINNLGLQLDQAGREFEAEARYRQALAFFHTIRADNPRRAATETNLGRLLIRTGRASTAEPLLRDVLILRQSTLPPNHWIVADARVALGACLAARGRLQKALELLSDGVAILQSALGPANRRTQRAQQELLRTQNVAVLSWAAEIPWQ